MIREHIIEILTKIKEIDATVHLAYDLGIDIINFDNGVALLEKSIPVLLREEKDDQFKWIDDLVGWWLYETVEKIIIVDENTKINLEKVEDFTDYLIKEYYKNNETGSL